MNSLEREKLMFRKLWKRGNLTASINLLLHGLILISIVFRVLNLDWVKLQLNGSFRGEVYLEMTFYSATPPLARRPSKLSPKDRLWRPPVTPPKNKTSPNLKPQRSPLLGPAVLPTNVPDPSPSIPPGLPPQLRPGVPATIREDVGVSGSNIFQTSHIPPLPSQHSPRPPSISPRREDMPLPPVPPPPQQSLGDPTLRHIPYFNIYPSTETPKPSSQAQNIQHVPSILRPRNAKSSPIPLSNRQPEEPPSAFRDDYEDPQKRFQRELAVSDAEFAARLAEQEGINLERLRMEEADADLARRLSQEDEEQARRDGSIPGGWVE